MNNIEAKRHSLAHLLSAAVLEIYPDAKNTIGPAIDNGFYYDFEFSSPVNDGALKEIEKKMKKLSNTWKGFEKKEVSKEEAQEYFKDNQYKLELIKEISDKDEPLTFYTSGSFVDLCRGGHVEDMKEIEVDSWKLSRVAGAYWRGNEKNKMLTRIYGLAYDSKNELDAYEKQIEEAKKRDHRKIGQEMDLFTFSPLVGSGLPLWTPRGTIIRQELDNFVWELRKAKGYERVAIPHITKKDLYETSGHWAKFGNELFKVLTREGKEYAMKPMNCPHHTQIFNHLQRSYKDMPQRYAETTMVYRDEQSGELGGLTRVLSITQDDSHVFCRANQIKEEFFSIWDMVDTFYKTFGFSLRVRLSFRDPSTPEKYLGNDEVWESSQKILKEIAEERGADYFEAEGEAALYGPKIDFMAMDSLGREHQVATVQLDMNLPERFDLFCINEKGEKERIVMLHCAIMGSLERFIAVLIEHTVGAFPLWLSPTQVKILPIGEGHLEYSKKIFENLKASLIRVELDDSNESLGKKIRNAKTAKVPYLLVIGDKEVAENKVTLESREGNLGQISIEELLSRLQTEIKDRK
ncbi:MAG: threonine--tRNA ligase [bacterium]|nr:threonine--tRNA ligase [bacterium]